MRLHLVGLPPAITRAAASASGYRAKLDTVATMARIAGHEVVVCEPSTEGLPTEPTWDADAPLWREWNARCAATIDAEPHDLLGLIAGPPQAELAALTDLLTVEVGIGYPAMVPGFHCCFESRAWQHHVYGRYGIENGRFFDTVIPAAFDPDDFTLGPKGDYLLFLGRFTHRKGVGVAAGIAKRAGMPLVMAGDGARVEDGKIVGEDTILDADGITHLGVVNDQQRRELLAGARALLMPTVYIEPFGRVAVEAMLSGTPAVTTDFGAFPETVEQGVTGFRFSMLHEAIEAVHEALDLDPATIRARAVERFSLDAVAPAYGRWFDRLGTLWSDGWYAADPTDTPENRADLAPNRRMR